MRKEIFFKKQYTTKNASQTRSLGVFFAKKTLKTTPQKYAFILALQGELGAGKTTFLQGLAQGLNTRERAQSPTFVIMKKYKIRKKNSKFKNFYHIDCYRVNGQKEIMQLGFKKIVSAPESIIAIEWADKILSILPKNSLRLRFQVAGKKTRKIKLSIKK